MLLNEFKSALNPAYINIQLLFVSKDGDGKCSDIMDDASFSATTEKDFTNSSNVFAPMFFIDMSLGTPPTRIHYHEINGVQVDNWEDESLKFDLVKAEFDKLSHLLEIYKEDFFISVESCGCNRSNHNGQDKHGPNSLNGRNTILGHDGSTKTTHILNIAISLTMKDYFDYEQCKGI